MRLEPQMWDALESIARDEGVTLNSLCTQIDQRRRRIGLTSATRIFIVGYYRDLLRRHEGHAPATAPPPADRVLDPVAGRPGGRRAELPQAAGTVRHLTSEQVRCGHVSGGTWL